MIQEEKQDKENEAPSRTSSSYSVSSMTETSSVIICSSMS